MKLSIITCNKDDPLLLPSSETLDQLLKRSVSSCHVPNMVRKVDSRQKGRQTKRQE